jgi:SAM-dependent methyltransferase
MIDHAGSSQARDAATLAFYDAQAPVYTASGQGGVSRWLPDFMQALPAGARVLELGCGGGRDAGAMLANGFDVDVTDGTPAIAAKAEERLGRPVRVMKFDELAETNAYDAVWASASLLHVRRAALPDVLGRIYQALKPGGLHFASYKGGGSEGRDGFGRYFNYLDQDALLEAYASSGAWRVLSVDSCLGGGYDGRLGPWLAITARKPSP